MCYTDPTKHSLLIVTGSNLSAEINDRPLAYWLKSLIEDQFTQRLGTPAILVLSDLWYLHSEPLHKYPLISLGRPQCNAVSAHLVNKLPTAFTIDAKLTIQMDLLLQDLRACIWGDDRSLTVDALRIFSERNYLDNFLDAALTRSY